MPDPIASPPPPESSSPLWLKTLIGIDILLAAFLASDLILDPGSFQPFPFLLTIAAGVVLVAMLVYEPSEDTSENPDDDSPETHLRGPGAE